MSTNETDELLFRDLIYRFFKLRLSHRREIMKRMNIPLDTAAEKPDFIRFRDALIKVEGRDRMRQLAEMVQEYENASNVN